MAVIIAGLVTLFGFCVVWHIWWLAILALIGTVATIIIRSFDEHTEYVIPAKTIALLESGNSKGIAV
jgi:cytochrome o ubiquinol oxidase subunit I